MVDIDAVIARLTAWTTAETDRVAVADVTAILDHVAAAHEIIAGDFAAANRMVDAALVAERNRIAAEIEAAAMERPLSGARIGMAIAARICRRGRRLTAAEQMGNLSNALAESDVEHGSA